jgi:glycosyltransferase involved in cell wall biosynthesis
LAAVDENTDFGKEQEKIGCGFWSLSGDTESFKTNLLKLHKSRELREKMGLRGYDYMKNNLTTEHAYQNIMNQF